MHEMTRRIWSRRSGEMGLLSAAVHRLGAPDFTLDTRPRTPTFSAAAFSSAPPSRLSALTMMAVASPPRTKSSAVTRRGGGQLISWYFNSISSTRLLDKEQEQQLSKMIIAGDEYERLRDELEDELGRRPTTDEWATAVGLEKRELRKRMRRANSARDLMVAANSERRHTKP